MRGLNVRHSKIQDRAGMIEFLLFGAVQHQANPIAFQEGKTRRRFEQQLQAQHLLVKCSRAFHIMSSNLDLTQPGNSRSVCGSSHSVDLPFHTTDWQKALNLPRSAPEIASKSPALVTGSEVTFGT